MEVELARHCLGYKSINPLVAGFTGNVKALAQLGDVTVRLQSGLFASLMLVHDTGLFPGHWRLLFGANA
jgi:hypothetical protein